MKVSRSITLFLAFVYMRALILFVAIVLYLQTATALSNETDYTALLAIKSQLVDRPHGVFTSWNHSTNHCHWEGVTCGVKHNRVIQLNLNSARLAGTISPFIGNMSFLEGIQLYNNSLQGQIPPELGRLSRLKELEVYNNTLIGVLPANLSFCANLVSLDVSSNKLEGKLPTNLGALSKLKSLRVGQNNFNGPLFQVIANLTSLERISVFFNAFTGAIDDSICRVTNISTISVAENELSGVVPNCLFNLSSLQIIDLGGNQLQGKIPLEISFTLPKLYYLNLDENYFSGTIPNTITNLTGLKEVALSFNNFTGRMPQYLERLKNLNSLDFSVNQLEGDINLLISSLTNCSQLRILDIRSNYVTGILPESIVNLSATLTWLSIGNNPIRGTFPTGITKLINLATLYMYNNNLEGSLPQDFGNLQRLENVILRYNKLSGRLPNSMGNLSQLSGVDVQYNNLEGNIPPSLGNCRYLLQVYLENNKFRGTLPSELFEGSAKFLVINMAQNRLEGSIPFEISKQINLIEFTMSNNKLSGVIPGGLGSCTALQKLFLKGNSFQGNIPPSLSSLNSLQQIDLSLNNLSGAIPDYFSKFASLQYLNLSYNDFGGRVPTDGVFKNVTAVFLNGNSRLCGGISVLKLPKCNTESMRNRRTPFKITVIIPVLVVLAVLISFATALYLGVKNRRISILPGFIMTKQLMKVSYDMLLKATDGFSSVNLLGRGTFGSVFKGNLEGRTVAVKVLNLEQRGASKSFMAECKALRNIRHRNLVGIITACSSIDFQANEFKALVYEFMSNGNVDEWLHGARFLTLSQRLNIAIDVAHALTYLHHDNDTPIAHCDLKPSNVLLDDNMVAHVGDFGLAKFLAPALDQNQSSTTAIRGSVGYTAPEYGLGSEASPDGDLYSYGILLLELLTGKRPTDNTFQEENTLHNYVEAALPDKVLEIADPSLEDEEINEEIDDRRALEARVQRRVDCMTLMVSVGVACSQHTPQDRMRITDAISKLQAARDKLLNDRDRRHPRH